MCLLSGLLSIEKKVQSPPDTEENKQLAFKMFQVRGKTTLLCHLSNWANKFNRSVFVSFIITSNFTICWHNFIIIYSVHINRSWNRKQSYITLLFIIFLPFFFFFQVYLNIIQKTHSWTKLCYWWECR